jgi:hypothetical protein
LRIMPYRSQVRFTLWRRTNPTEDKSAKQVQGIYIIPNIEK